MHAKGTRVRKGLLNGLVAAGTAVVLAVGGTATPARAADATWVNVVITVAQSLFGGGGGGGDLERAKQEIIAAVNSAKQEILNHIDAIASADIRACAESATTLVAQIDNMDEFTLPIFALGAVDCATQSTAYFDAVQDIAAADRIGMLMGEIYAIAMVGFTKLGFPATDLLDQLIRGYEAVVARLVPTCTEHKVSEYDDSGRPVYTEIQYTCVAYNGDKGYDVETYYRGKLVGPRLNRDAVSAEATRNTSRGVAINALPLLRQARGA
jgi:hypothetical protein